MCFAVRGLEIIVPESVNQVCPRNNWCIEPAFAEKFFFENESIYTNVTTDQMILMVLSILNLMTLEFVLNTYGWYCPGGDSHTKNVHIFLKTADFVTFWWYFFESVQQKYLWQISSETALPNLNQKNVLGRYQKVA